MMLLQYTEQRLGFDHGDIYAVTDSRVNHAVVSANMRCALGDALGDAASCRVYMVDRVVRLIPDVTKMPDVVVTCERTDQGEVFSGLAASGR